MLCSFRSGVRFFPHRRPRNAIQVKNIANIQVGHIPRDIAARLAPLMDRKLVTVEGIMVEGNRKCFLGKISLSHLGIVRGFHYALAL